MAMGRAAGSAARILHLAPASLRSSPSQRSSSRTFASGGHGPERVPIWQDPLSPSKWKEEHFVFVSLAGWGLLFYGGYKLFTGGPKKEPKSKLEAAHH